MLCYLRTIRHTDQIYIGRLVRRIDMLLWKLNAATVLSLSQGATLLSCHSTLTNIFALSLHKILCVVLLSGQLGPNTVLDRTATRAMNNDVNTWTMTLLLLLFQLRQFLFPGVMRLCFLVFCPTEYINCLPRLLQCLQYQCATEYINCLLMVCRHSLLHFLFDVKSKQLKKKCFSF